MAFEALTTYLSQEIPGPKIPGCDILIYRHGKQIYRKQFGWRNYLQTEPVSTNDYYFLYSCSKVLTCSSVMHLIEEGKAALDDEVAKYIPAFSEVRLENGSKPKQPILLRHCFSMTGGLDYDLKTPAILEVLQQNPNATALEVASAIAKTPLHSEPGTHYRYSLGHDVLAAVAERITGKPFADYIREWAFNPLGLTHIFFEENEETRHNMAAQFRLGEGPAVKPYGRTNEFLLSPCYHSGGAGLIAQAEDYARFLAELSKNGGCLLRPETVAQMKVGQLSGEAQKEFRGTGRWVPYNYGLGVYTLEHPELTGHKIPKGVFGWDGAAGSFTMIDTENELAVFYAQHVRACSHAYNKIHPTVRNLVYQELGL